ncbi:MAG TPA: 6-carboxytetrahydropterin synthase QueD [Armatimonadota bacterium]|nr:6-carboxytetrahydropterin synthase QueD [Armatimonadota bacterium]
MSDGDLWQRFTDPATRVLQYAQDEARKLGASTVGTEHVLLGLLREGDGIAARVLERLGISLGRVRSEIHRQLGPIDNRISTEAPINWSPKAKRVLELALEEANELNPRLGLPSYIDTEHILLGLIREGEGQAAGVLRSMGVDLDRVRKEVVNHLGGTPALGQARPRPRPAPALSGALPIYELTVEAEFSAAHSLERYDGPCADLHGHNYRVVIQLAGEELDHRGMLLDFREIKHICDSFVNELDHKHLNQLPPFAQQNPTSENIARHIFHHVAGAISELPALGDRRVWPVRATVYESAKSAASYGEPSQR